jgi:hypothetical protein
VGPGHGNMWHGGAIGLTTGRMAVTAGSGRALARAHGRGTHGGSGIGGKGARCWAIGKRTSYTGR